MAVAKIDVAGNAGLEARVVVLEDNEYKITYFTEINTATGTIIIPTGATILLDQLFSGIDAYVSTIQNGQPTGDFPKTGGGVTVDVSSFDALGNYTLTGTPSSFPVALIYVLKIKAVDYSILDITKILDLESMDQFDVPVSQIVYGSVANKPTTSADFFYVPSVGYVVLGNTLSIGKFGGTNFLQSGSGVGSNLDIYSSFTWQTGFINMNGKDISTVGIFGLTTTTNSSPVDGQIWWDGSNFKGRVGGVTKTFTLV